MVGKKLVDKICLITGATMGIGAETAKLFHEEGGIVIITARSHNAEADKFLADMNNERPESAFFMSQDVSIEKDWIKISEFIQTTAKFGQLDVCVNNAGVFVSKDIEHETLESFKRVQSINTDSVFLGCKYAINLMKQHGGSIINLSSFLGLVGDSNAPSCCAAKGAVRVLTKSIALHCAEKKYNIRVNSICPGCIMTPMVMKGLSKEDADYYSSLHPIGRPGEPREIANGILFLASNDSSFMTGSDLVMDGGITCK